MARYYKIQADVMAADATVSTGVDIRQWDRIGLQLPVLYKSQTVSVEGYNTDSSVWAAIKNPDAPASDWTTGAGTAGAYYPCNAAGYSHKIRWKSDATALTDTTAYWHCVSEGA